MSVKAAQAQSSQSAFVVNQASFRLPGSGPRPRGEPLPQSCHLLRAEPVAGEYPVWHPVQLPARVGEVTVLKVRIQPFGQGDQLIDGVMLQGGRRVDVVPWLHPAGFPELTGWAVAVRSCVYAFSARA